MTQPRKVWECSSGWGHSQGLREWGRPTVTAEHRAAAPFLPFQSQANPEKTENPPRIFDSSPRIMSSPPHFQEDVQTALFSGTLSTDGTICNSSLLLIHLLQIHQHLLVFLHFSLECTHGFYLGCKGTESATFAEISRV